ncbi:MAG: PIG-L family deacetylase [Clostridia bacterium]|nr:PIG-L family deacetylase [Clostridia bacterium]
MADERDGRNAVDLRLSRLKQALKRATTIILLIWIAFRFSGCPSLPRFAPDRVAPPWLTYSSISSALVFAPHSDDETMGCAGVIMHTLDSGGSVKVVLITNGDGFRAAAEGHSKKLLPSKAQFMALGYTRQRETASALGMLGLAPTNIEYLGYPDRGLSKMWTDRWDYSHLYTSRYTRANRSPYANSYRPGAPYCGASLAEDVAQIIRDFQPSHIFIPNPHDAHPDHWSTFAIVSYALGRLRAENALTSNPQVYGYLVHRGDWPLPRGWHPGWALDPPATLSRLPGEWIYMPLSKTEEHTKNAAIGQYHTQFLLMRLYMLSFVRTNELFLSIASPIAPSMPDWAEQAKDRRGFWQDTPAVVYDPIYDTITRLMDVSADLRSISCAVGESNLYILLKARGRVSNSVVYTVTISNFDLHRTMIDASVGPGNVTRATATTAGGKKTGITAQATTSITSRIHIAARYTDAGLEIAIPLSSLGESRGMVLIEASTQVGSAVVDHTAWTVVRLNPDAPDIFR